MFEVYRSVKQLQALISTIRLILQCKFKYYEIKFSILKKKIKKDTKNKFF